MIMDAMVSVKMPDFGAVVRFTQLDDGEYLMMITPSCHVVRASGAVKKLLNISNIEYGVIVRWMGGMGPAPAISDMLVTGMDESENAKYITS